MLLPHDSRLTLFFLLPGAFSDFKLKSGCILYLPLVGVSESTVNTDCSSGLQLQFDFAPMTEKIIIRQHCENNVKM